MTRLAAPPRQVALDSAAAVARRAMASDAAAVAWYLDDQDALLGADGARHEDLAALRASLGAKREQNGTDGAATERFADAGFATHLSAPLVVDRRTVGSLHVLRRERADLDRALAEAIAAHCAVSLHTDGVGAVDECTPPPTQREALDQLALSTSDFLDLIPRLDAALTRTLGPVVVGVMVWDPDRLILQLVRGSFGASEDVTATYQVDPADLHSNAALVFDSQRVYLSNHALGDPGILQHYVKVFGISRLISAPLTVGSRPIGVLHVARRTGAAFTPADLAACTASLPGVGIAVESTRMLHQLSLQHDVEAVLAGQAVAIAGGGCTKGTLRRGLEALRRLLSSSVIAFVPREGTPLVNHDDATDRRTRQRVLDDSRGERAERATVVQARDPGDTGSATLHLPVRLGVQFVGTLTIHRARSWPFVADERRWLSRMAHLIALSWASERYQQQRAELARLEERQRIADDLHDHVAQIFFAAQTRLDNLLDRPIPQDARSDAARARALLTRGDSAIRTAINQLSRPVATGLVERLHEVVHDVSEEFAVTVHIDIAHDAIEPVGHLRRSVVEVLLKAAREGLVNAAKHAGPCHITVAVDVPSQRTVRLRVIDTGVGIRRRKESHGLVSLRRNVRRGGGALRIAHGRAGGTTLSVRFDF